MYKFNFTEMIEIQKRSKRISSLKHEVFDIYAEYKFALKIRIYTIFVLRRG